MLTQQSATNISLTKHSSIESLSGLFHNETSPSKTNPLRCSTSSPNLGEKTSTKPSTWCIEMQSMEEKLSNQILGTTSASNEMLRKGLQKMFAELTKTQYHGMRELSDRLQRQKDTVGALSKNLVQTIDERVNEKFTTINTQITTQVSNQVDQAVSQCLDEKIRAAIERQGTLR